MDVFGRECLEDRHSHKTLWTQIPQCRLEVPCRLVLVKVHRCTIIEDWTGKIETINMHKGEESRYFAWVDEISSVVDSFGVVKSENEIIQKIVRGLSDDFSTERRKFRYEETPPVN